MSSLPAGCATREQLNRLALLIACGIALAACGSGSPAARSTSSHRSTSTTSHSTAETMITAPLPTSSTSSTTTTMLAAPRITTTTTTASSSAPTADQVQIAQGGCSSMQDLSDVISNAADQNSAQPLQDMENSDPDYEDIADLALLSGVSAYQKLGTDAGPFKSDVSAAISTGNLSTVEQLATTLTADCTALGLATTSN